MPDSEGYVDMVSVLSSKLAFPANFLLENGRFDGLQKISGFVPQ
jgi:hypothetical protein